MKKIYSCLLLCLLSATAFALNGPCTPGGVGTGYSGTTTYCVGATASPITYNYSECSIGIAPTPPTGVNCTATWYYNTTNTTVISGSTVTVSGPTAFTSAAGTNGDLPTFTPVTTAAGTYYYFCVVEWTDPGTCASPFVTGTRSVTINPNPAPIAGSSSVCVNSTIALSTASTGGTWSSSNLANATVGATSGIVTGMSFGTANISYTLSSTGCYAIKAVTIDSLPTPITGITTLCMTTTTTLSSGSGGTWSSSNGLVATVDPSGVVTSVSAGTALIDYTLSTGCARSAAITVNPTPAIISGASTLCTGLTTTLTNSNPGGTWSSSNTTVATISSGGVVTAGAAGTSNITYTLPTGCFRVSTMTINQTPAAITGTLAICNGFTSSLSNATPGGLWSTSNASVASIDFATGVVTANAVGTATISYVMPTGCRSVIAATVNVQPGSITGSTSICNGAISTLANSVSGGVWSSSTGSVATIGTSTGVVTSVGPGNTTISYILPNGCNSSTIVSVNPLPGAITGNAPVCTGGTVSLANSVAGGTWSSSAPSIAAVGSSSGVLTGVAAGTATITYALSTGCRATTIATVNITPVAITGTTVLCQNQTVTLTNTTVGGTWSSSNTAVATITASGVVVPGSTAGTTDITYMMPSGCFRTTTVTVNPTPGAITGPNTVCVGSTITLANALAGGIWSSSNTAFATVTSGTGVVTGVSASIVVSISYTMGTGCRATLPVTVYATPAAITGNTSICNGAISTLADVTAGGTWSSSNTAAATIGVGTGVVSSVAVGTSTISYILSSGCYNTTTVSVNTQPAASTGTPVVCVGGTTTLANGTAGGTWTSSNNAIATVGASTGAVNGVAAGTAIISYSLSTGCRVTTVVTVNGLPTAITGGSTVCLGSSISLSSTPAGGTWSSSNGNVTVGLSSGVATGSVVGSSTITYTLSTGCVRTTNVTVQPLPAAIGGTLSVCVGSTTSLTNASTGGTWSSSNPGVASIGASTGVVNGLAFGTSTITYTLATGCRITDVVTVNSLPANISGTTNVCVGSTITLADATLGGTWGSSNSNASIDASGVVTGVTAGTSVITYMLSTGCYKTQTVTVNALPAPIGGASAVCIGSTATLTDATAGGTWSSSTTGVATIVLTSGVATGISAGTTIITYRLTATGCIDTAILTVNSLPTAITGTPTVCFGLTTSLSSTPTGGTWTSSNSTIANVDASGVVTGAGVGTARITYSLGTGCLITQLVTVNPLPNTFTGSLTVCMGSTSTLTSTTGGTWSSSVPAIGTIGATTGVLGGVGVAGGNTDITYTLPTGCIRTAIATVNPLPSAISGTMAICFGDNTTLSSTPATGTWTSSNAAVATIDASGVVTTGTVSGTSIITYTLGTSCRVTSILTVNPLPNAITGSLSVCTGLNTTLATTTPGGTWSSSNTLAATVSPSGVVFGVGAGTTIIDYTLGTGCFRSVIVTVNQSPAAIAGTAAVCLGLTTTLTNSVGTGVWSSSNVAVAPIDAAGVVTGSVAGTSTITYALGTCIATRVVTVNSLPTAISGTLTVCENLTTTLTSSPAGGTWMSSVPGNATVGTSGVVTGVSAGTSAITYTLSTGCIRTAVVNVLDAPSPISGITALCATFTTTLSNTEPGGAWNSSNPVVATVNASGVVTGVAAGNAVITYTLPTGCSKTQSVTVNAVPSVISGTPVICENGTTNLASTPTGGVWSSSNTGVAIVSGSGTVIGVGAGISVIDYTLSTGCYRSVTVTVNPAPTPITGTNIICTGSTTTLSSAPSGGVWSSSNASLASVDASGVVTGVAAGFVNITYSLTSGCSRVAPVTVNATPSNIAGVPFLCQGSTTSLTSTPAGGTWDSDAPSVVIVTTTGTLVTAVAPGTATISYTLSNGCYKTVIATVSPVPGAISGPASVCVASSATFSNPTPGGNWTSSNTAIATVGFTSGVVNGVAQGVATITYSLTSGCRVTVPVSVNPLPGVITGSTLICVGNTTTLGNSTGGGSWSSVDMSVATIGSGTGVMTGLVPGTTTISYTIGATGCARTTIATVSALPATITGSVNVCVGSSSLLSNATTGGSWTSSNIAIASIGSTTGLLVGNNAGVATITYALSSGCYTTTPVTVNPLPAAITGGLNVCVNSTSALSTSTTGGTWLSGNPSVADVDAFGLVTGYSTGIAPISYTVGTGCSRVVYVTVNPLPSPIVGLHGICISSTTTLTNATSGGQWTSSNTAVANIGLTNGVVTPASSGTTLISYTLTTGCRDTFTLSVHPLPSAIAGPTVMCVGSSVTLTNSMTGGTWSSSSSVVATIGSSSGIVTGNSTGVAGITYSLGTGCRTTTVVTVNTIPAAITGVASVCEGGATILNNVTPGGVWSTENPTIATISPTGIVAGIAPATVVISYTLSSGCARTIVVTVNATPPPINGVSTMCIGNCTTFSNDTTGGVWNSSNPTVASVGISSGVVCGLTGGTALITYTLGTGCQSEYLVTVNTVPPPITGIATVCQGLTTTLSNSVMGGTWVSQDPAIANVGYTTGIVTGLLPGQDTIFYQLVGGCTSFVIVTVNATPLTPTWSVGGVPGTGAPNVCVGSTITMSSIPSGGTWASSSLPVATVGLSSGVVSGLTAGTSTLTYTLGTGCQSMVDVIVNPMPSPITGIDHVCSGQTTTFYNSIPGGVWSTTNPSVASVDASTGAISGGASDTATITYALTPTCSVSKIVSVDATPAIIGGFLEVCAGSATTLTNATADGLWSSTNTAVAPIGLTTGIVTGVSVGTATISYTLLGTGCASTAVMTVNAVPATITGSATVCEAGTTTLSSTTAAGVWTVDDATIAIIGSGTGVVTGLDSGATTVTYQIPTTGCYTTKTIAVNPIPAPIAGASVVCEASTTTLTNTTPFGTWISSTTSVATVGSTSGAVAGASAGTATITYMLGTGCYVTQQFTVDPVPAALTGVPHVCVGTTTFLASATAGGVWSSSNTAVGTVAAGNVTGIGTGTTGITYTLSTGCAASVIVTVEAVPTPISGTLTICEGSTTTLGSTPFGGTWTSGTPGVATIDPATGLVTAIAAGTSLITYATPVAGCYVTAIVSVDPLPSAIAGITSVCEASSITLSNLSSGGSWSSDNVTVATIGSTGIVDGIAAGTATISYTMASGCAATGIVTVNPLPNAGTITGAASVCKNSTITLVSTVLDGKWYSNDTDVLKIDTLTGVALGVDSGSTDVIYVYTNMCGSDTANQTVVVNPLPNAGVITGIPATCIGYTTTLSSSVAGGVWTSSNPAIATVSTAGVVFGVSPGTVLIRYMLTTICGTDTVAQAVTIHGLAPHTPIAIHPDSAMCANVLWQNFGAAAAPTAGYSFSWSAVNAEVFATSPDKQFSLVSFHAPGTAIVMLTTHVLSSGCSMVDSFVATIGTTEALTPEVRYYNSELICMENTADSYQWGYDDVITFDSTLIPGATHQDYYLPVPDFTHKLYWVMMVKNGCRSKTYYNAPTSVNSAVVADLDIRIFPNPAQSLVNILVSGVNSYDKVDVRLMDMTGKDLYMGTFDGGKGSINVSELPSGVYSVMLTRDGVKIGARTFVKN